MDGIFDAAVEPVSQFALVEGELRFLRDVPVPIPAPVSPAPTPAPIFACLQGGVVPPCEGGTVVWNSTTCQWDCVGGAPSLPDLLAPILDGGGGGGIGRLLPFGTAGTRLIAGEQRRSPLLAILILVVIGGIGYFVYRRYRKGRES